MLGIGLWEMLLLMGIGLIVIGPEKFPDFAKMATRAFRDFRGYMDEMKSEIAKEVRPVQRELREVSRYDPEAYIDTFSETIGKMDEDDVEPVDKERKAASASPQDAENIEDSGPFKAPEPGPAPTNQEETEAGEAAPDPETPSQRDDPENPYAYED
jgi:Tat protein translocase TatB subunit